MRPDFFHGAGDASYSELFLLQLLAHFTKLIEAFLILEN